MMSDGGYQAQRPAGSLRDGCLPWIGAAVALWLMLAGVGYLVWELVK
jgi:hypothetical protein